jgi:hypothetical protein
LSPEAEVLSPEAGMTMLEVGRLPGGDRSAQPREG